MFAMFAISPIMQRFALPGIGGIACIVVGAWQKIDWLMIVGIVLAAPVIWAYAVLLFVYFPWLLFESLRNSLGK